VDGRGLKEERSEMGSFEPVRRPPSRAAEGDHPTDTEALEAGGLGDDVFDVTMLTSSREAFTGFSNLAAIPPLLHRQQTPPWRRRARGT
jgi:hypothetical protein